MDSQFFIILAALVFSAFLKGSLGMGFSTICLAILANFIDLKTAISIVILPSLLSNLIVMIKTDDFVFSLKAFTWLFIMLLPGMWLGLQILRQENSEASITILAVVLISYGIWGLLNHSARLPDGAKPILDPIVGIFTGCINGATGSQILPITPYLLSLNVHKSVIVQTLNIAFTISSLIMIVALQAYGSLNSQQMLTYSLGLVPVAFGVWLGSKMHEHLSEQLFRQLVQLLVIVLGGLLLLR